MAAAERPGQAVGTNGTDRDGGEDEHLAEQIPRAEKFIGFPMLLVFQALKAARGAGG